MKIKDINGLIKTVIGFQVSRNAQPEYGHNAEYIVFFDDTTFSHFEENVDVIEVHDGLYDLVKASNIGDIQQVLKSVLDAFAPGDGRCVTVQTKQSVLNDVRILLERVKGES